MSPDISVRQETSPQAASIGASLSSIENSLKKIKKETAKLAQIDSAVKEMHDSLVRIDDYFALAASPRTQHERERRHRHQG